MFLSGNESLPRKHGSLASHSRRDNRDYRDRDRGYRDRDRGHRDRDYDRESDRSDRSDRHYKPPTYREALRHDTSRSESELGDATEHSFVQADDDHPQKTFIERVITPRVKPAKKSPVQQKRVIPPPEEDMTYDSIEPKKSKVVEVQKDEEETDTEESDTSNTDNESQESEEVTDSEEEQPKKVDKPDAADVYSKVKKDKAKEAKGGPEGGQPPQGQGQGFMPPQQGFMPPPQNMQGPGFQGYFPPSVHHPQPRYGYPMQQVPPYQGQLPPQGRAPQGPRPDPYSQANFTVPMNQPGPQYPGQGLPPRTQYNPPPQNRQPHHVHKHDNKPSMPQQPSNPPVYSYLVNRGYQPLDGRHSPVSTSTGGSHLSGDRNLQAEESDFSANLDSGVELLKR